MESPIQITFSVKPGEDGDRAARFDFWDSPRTIQWFKDHGYTLYQRIGDSSLLNPTFPSITPDINSVCYPFAHYDAETSDNVQPLSGKIAYAQDSLNRHVAIKIVPAESDEYRILHFLNQQETGTMEINCIIPVLDLLPTEAFYFAVMPRWGYNIVSSPPLTCVQDMVTIIHSLLKGLAYLHENNIAHGDITLRNVLTNHITDAFRNTRTRLVLRRQKRLKYAMFDFDWSIMLPANADKRTFRLPYRRSWGTFTLIRDTHAGEFDYNPFIFDVGVMGSVLCMEFQHLSKKLPMLAPLLDRMTTWDLDRRFTASEALRFFEDRLSEVGNDQLQRGIHREDDQKAYDNYDRWEGLPPDFLQTWEAYRTPPVPWRMRLLRQLTDVPFFCHIIPRIRLFFHRLSSLFTLKPFRSIYSSKFSS